MAKKNLPLELTIDDVSGMVGSGKDFPVDFDQAWKWIGYSRKDVAKRALLGAGFLEGSDFRIIRISVDNSRRGPKTEKIQLSVDCFN